MDKSAEKVQFVYLHVFIAERNVARVFKLRWFCGFQYSQHGIHSVTALHSIAFLSQASPDCKKIDQKEVHP